MSGLVLCLIAATFATSKDVCSKLLASKISPTQSTFYSFVCALPFYLLLTPIVLLLEFEIFVWSGAFLGVLILRALSDWGAESFKMKALSQADLSLAASFLALSPVFLLFLAPVITGDVVGLHGVLSVVCVVVGSLILTFPTKTSKLNSSTISTKGIVFALTSSFFFALNTCFDRLAVQSAGPFQAAFGVTLLAALFCLPSMRRHPQGIMPVLKEQSSTARLLWGRGALEVIFMVAKLSALLFLAPQYVVALMKVSLLFTTGAGLFLLGERDRMRRMAASGVIFLGIVLAIGELLGELL